MGFRKHYTYKQKLQRNCAYWLLRNVAGLDARKALKIRDWTDNKILLILKGEANPIC